MIAGLEKRYSGNGYRNSWPANCKCDQEGLAAQISGVVANDAQSQRPWKNQAI